MNSHTIELLWDYWSEPCGWFVRLHGKDYSLAIDSIPMRPMAQIKDLTDSEAECMVRDALEREGFSATAKAVAEAVLYRTVYCPALDPKHIAGTLAVKGETNERTHN